MSIKTDEKKRVVITGLGMITALGLDVSSNWLRLLKGESAIDRIRAFDASEFPNAIGTEIANFDIKKLIGNNKLIKLMTKSVTYAVACARQAVTDSGLLIESVDPAKIGVYIGSGEAGPETHELFPGFDVSVNDSGLDFRKFGLQGLHMIDPHFSLRSLPNAGLCFISIICNAQGINNNFVNSAVASSQAIGSAFRAIQRAEADIIITGGYDSLLSEDSFLSYNTTGMLSANKEMVPSRAYKPFDVKRDGFVLGEGAGILILEELTHALRRKAHIYGEVIGYGCSSCAYHPLSTEPNGDGLALTIKNALLDTGVSSDEVDYICAHGEATIASDVAETKAIKNIFKKNAYSIPVSSLKPMLGYVGAASGAIELICTILMINKGFILPTINYENFDPNCDLDYVPNISREKDINKAISINKGFGGQNTAILVSKYITKY